MCKFGTGRRGVQGFTGPTGPAGSSVSLFTSGVVALGSAKTLNIITSAASTGQVVYSGLVNIQTSTSPNEITIVPSIGGVQQTGRQVVQTMPTQIGGFCRSVVHISGVLTITAGQTFDLVVSLNSYVNSGQILSASINYNLQ